MGYFLLDTETIPALTVYADSIVSCEAFDEPIIDLTDYLKINADDSIISEESFEIPQLNQSIFPESILTVEVFGDLVIGTGIRTVYVFRIPSAETFETPAITIQIIPTSIGSSEVFNNPIVGPYNDEPFEKEKQTISQWKPIKQATGNEELIDETIWDEGLTSWDNGNTHWDASISHEDVMKKASPSSTFVTQGKQSSSTFTKQKQGSTSFTAIKEK